MHDVFFLSYDEPHAEPHWVALVDQVPYARRVKGVDGIQAAHAECASRARTKHFFVVDADNEVIDFSPFDYEVPNWDADYVHLWFARNPVNGLEYGWGGIKLFPKSLFDDLGPMRLDMTTSFALKIIPQVCSITRFNTSEFEAWRSAFREAVKLSLSDSEEARGWLEVWTSYRAASGPFKDFCVLGARDGVTYVEQHRDDPEALARINDYAWLRKQFGS